LDFEVAMDHASGEWGIVRADWVDHPEVGPDEFALLALLSLYANRDGSCWPSQSTLADRLKRSRSWIIRVLNRLEDLGLVARTQRQAARGRRATCLYTLAGHAEAVVGTPARGGSPSDQSPDDAGDRASARRVVRMEQEHRNPANAGLSRRDRAAGEGESDAWTGDGGRAGRVTARTVPPEDWTPSPADRAFAAENAPGVDADCFARRFAASCRAHGYRYADHGAAFRAWLLNRWEKPNANSARQSCGTPLPRHRDDSHGRPRCGGASAVFRCSDARTAANRDTARAALALLAG
jgi:predicted RNA-binding Zn-ribbon protein involved in translation (DUF1610 family)